MNVPGQGRQEQSHQEGAGASKEETRSKKTEPGPVTAKTYTGQETYYREREGNKERERERS